MPDQYVCQNIFSDITATKPNSWVCRVVENAYDFGIVSKN
jgi:hypothetical protein